MDLNILQERLAMHEAMEFPEFPDDPDFADWVEELFEVDDYYFGLLSSMIAEGAISDPINMAPLAGLQNTLDTFAVITEEQKTYRRCVAYLASLESVLQATQK